MVNSNIPTRIPIGTLSCDISAHQLFNPGRIRLPIDRTASDKMGGEAIARAPSSFPRAPDHPVGQRIHSIYTDRLRQFVGGGAYSEVNLTSCVNPTESLVFCLLVATLC